MKLKIVVMEHGLDHLEEVIFRLTDAAIMVLWVVIPLCAKDSSSYSF